MSNGAVADADWTSTLKTLVSDTSDAVEQAREKLRSQYQADALSTKMESIS